MSLSSDPIEFVLDHLSDGKAQSIEELQKESDLTERKLLIVLAFLRESGFVEINEKKRLVSLPKHVLKFIDGFEHK